MQGIPTELFDARWLPGEFFGPFEFESIFQPDKFNEPFINLTEEFHKDLEEFYRNQGKVYDRGNEYSKAISFQNEKFGWGLVVENEIIESVSSDKFCFYKGKNLINMSIEECIQHLDVKVTKKEVFSEEERECYTGDTCYYFDTLGAMIWVMDGFVESIDNTVIYAEDDNTVIHPFRHV